MEIWADHGLSSGCASAEAVEWSLGIRKESFKRDGKSAVENWLAAGHESR